MWSILEEHWVLVELHVLLLFSMSEMSILKEHGVHVELHVLLLFSMSERSILKNMESLLNFMYQGEVNINQSRITEFLATAEDLKIKG